MNLEALTLEVRPRTAWESMDLSVRLCLQHWRILITSWLVTVLPIFIVITGVLLEEHPYWAFFLVWFLKPLYDRVPLFVLSRVIFSEPIRWQDVLRAVPGFFKTGIISALTIYRLDMGRAFALPTVQLEGLRGKQRHQRMKALRRGAKNREGLLFILCFHLESFLSWGIIGLVLILLPTDLALKGAEVVLVNDEPPLWVNALTMMMYFFAMMVVEILYVAGGFMLYLNRRTILEGWDIELSFRKMQQKYRARKLSAVAVILLCLLLPLGFPEPVSAEVAYDKLRHELVLPPMAAQKLPPEKSAEVIERVMRDPVFNREKTESYLKYTGTPEKREEKDRSSLIRSLGKFFDALGKLMALVFEGSLWMVILGLVILIIKYWQRLKIAFGGFKSNKPKETPETLFGLDIREESLPDNIRAEALKLIQAHQYRAALALLYRASLAYLVKHYALELSPGATEGDCVQAVRQHLSAQQEIHYFIKLTEAWQLTAYAHRELEEAQMRTLVIEGAIFYDRLKTDADNNLDSGSASGKDGGKDHG